MNALILAAGKGTRLNGIEPGIPKPMLIVGESPLLDINIRKLLNLGVERIVVNVHHYADVIINFVQKQDYASKIKIAYEKELLGTAGTLKSNLEILEGGDFIVLHGDNFFNDDLTLMLSNHAKSDSKICVSMGTFKTDDVSNCGTVVLDSNSVVTEFYEKNSESPSQVANSAIYLFKPCSVELIRSLQNFETDISIHLLPKFIGKILAIPLQGFFVDIGSPERLKHARELAK